VEVGPGERDGEAVGVGLGCAAVGAHATRQQAESVATIPNCWWWRAMGDLRLRWRRGR
jgi:hypothetical protein